MTPTQEDAELADFILGRSARLVDLERITAFRLAAEEAGFRAGLEWGESARIEGVRMEREQIVAWLLKDDTRLAHEESSPEVQREYELWWAADAIERGDHTAIRQIDPTRLGAE